MGGSEEQTMWNLQKNEGYVWRRKFLFKKNENKIFFKKAYKWTKLFKESQNSIQDEDMPGRPIMVSTPERVDSVNLLILADNKE